MMVGYTGKYRDERGEESITIENDGKLLVTVIRNIRFEGDDFTYLEPQASAAAVSEASFTLFMGDLCECVLEFEMPILLEANGEPINAVLHVQIDMRKPHPLPEGEIDECKTPWKLSCADQEVSSQGKSGDFGDALYELQKALPLGYIIKCCSNCAFSLYGNGGYGSFGCLACFRDNKEGIVAVKSKGDLFTIWHTQTELVQETYLCADFQMRDWLKHRSP